MFESSKVGILILNADIGLIVDVNPYLMDLLGYSKEQFLEKSIWDIGFFSDVVESKENYLELLKNNYIRYEDLPLRTAGGKSIHVEYVSNVYIENGINVVQCNIRDITERFESKEALRISEDKFDNYIEHAPGGVFIADEKGQYIGVNRASSEISDITADESTIQAAAYFAALRENKKNER